MTTQEQSDIRTLVETFWEYDSGWGSTPEEREAARRLQKAIGYETPWDKARELGYVPASGATTQAKEDGAS